MKRRLGSNPTYPPLPPFTPSLSNHPLSENPKIRKAGGSKQGSRGNDNEGCIVTLQTEQSTLSRAVTCDPLFFISRPQTES
ncbi:hypothetical protein CDAR_304581 [Caerostris darwini]|uniref:Uncharacterized protein n=1 Tax=Caerostris darwini TaxID=1538125 RepID=A0AAV4NJK8_9ARAC|nr:hypothetical protein CDAR_304581 [Caerostris darwini]